MTLKKVIKVLVAEDDFLVSEGISRVLKTLGYEQIGDAANGKEAVAMACEMSPDVILMDIKMSKLDGLEACRQIQENCPAPVVILTAYESTDLVTKASKMGVAAYLTKPARPAEIESAITIAIARHGDMMELRRLNSELEFQKRELDEALTEVRDLRRIIPICAKCKKVRDDTEYWEQVENYLSDRSLAQFSYGLCTSCTKGMDGDDSQNSNINLDESPI